MAQSKSAAPAAIDPEQPLHLKETVSLAWELPDAGQAEWLLPVAATPSPETPATPGDALESGEEPNATDFIDSELQPVGDPELGILRLRERPLPKPTQPKFVFLTSSFSYFRSDNILSSEIDTIDEQLVGGRLILSARPAIGPRTLLIGAIEGNLIRYGDLSDLDYNGFGLKAGVRHFWSRQAYSELSWDNRQLFLRRDGDRFLNDHSLRLSMFYRVPLAARLKLDNYYQLRWSIAEPTDRSRLVNRLGTVLEYELTPTLRLGLNYQYDLTHFTQRDREDSYHQALAQLSWDLSRSLSLNVYGGYSFGASTDSDVSFKGSILGGGLSLNLPLF
ncbi:outer membrane beta-barrel protein [Trichothermofontia sichuanensis B231]|uniref:outer membrane beta-barrel protein n=1 Tax=Trichothermofontia sichuanensis TaxID=3045816 RepID=UPI0022479D4D|nr:outer membrane beta-barrel protein [Trichothermofontia sichuanensis]UZQ55067.1 outer membrane beta-barrel protein [Trichothermofontia sichuanensis B231]